MAVDPAFKGAGKKEGLEIFRIEVRLTTDTSLAILSNVPATLRPTYHVTLK